MGQKSSPIALRIGIHKGWASRWFGGRKYASYLEQDITLRTLLERSLKSMAVDAVDVERSTDAVNITISTARPGLLIGRSGSGVEELKAKVKRLYKGRIAVRIEIKEVKQPELSARIMAESMVDQVEKRIPYRRILKQTIAKIMAAKGARGVKLQMGGRLDGSEIARSEHLEEGQLPLHTFRADIDFAKVTAMTTYGTIGIKVWIYKGEVFEE